MIAPEIEAELEILPFDQSPRHGALRDDVVGYYGCPLKLGSDAFDCRITFPDTGGSVALGTTARALIQFLSPSLVLPRLVVGSTFELWERGPVARGRVTRKIKGEQVGGGNGGQTL